MAMLRMSLRPHIALLHDVNHRLDTCPDHLPTVRQEMTTSRRVLYDVMEKQARQIHWIRAILFTAVSDVDGVICVYMHVHVRIHMALCSTLYAINTLRHNCGKAGKNAIIAVVACFQEKRDDLAWLLKVVVNTLDKSSRDGGQLFSLVPHYYVTLLLDLCLAVRSFFSWDIDRQQAASTCISLSTPTPTATC